MNHATFKTMLQGFEDWKNESKNIIVGVFINYDDDWRKQAKEKRKRQDFESPALLPVTKDEILELKNLPKIKWVKSRLELDFQKYLRQTEIKAEHEYICYTVNFGMGKIIIDFPKVHSLSTERYYVNVSYSGGVNNSISFQFPCASVTTLLGRLLKFNLIDLKTYKKELKYAY